MSEHVPVTTLDDLLSLDNDEKLAGYRDTVRGDPEPGSNHSRAYHHGWRMRMMDLAELPIPEAHRRLLREYVRWLRANRE